MQQASAMGQNVALFKISIGQKVMSCRYRPWGVRRLLLLVIRATATKAARS